MSSFNATFFHSQLDSALVAVRKSLDVDVVPKSAEDVPHSYDDKFKLAEYIGEAGTQSIVSLLSRIGMKETESETAKNWVTKDRKTVTLRFSVTSECTFIEKEKITITPDVQRINEVSALGFKLRLGNAKQTKIEYRYDFQHKYCFSLFRGAETESNGIVLATSTVKCIKCCYDTDTPPHSKVTKHPDIDVDLTWLFESNSSFKIDRSSLDTKTPRRNDSVDSLIGSLGSLEDWASSVEAFFDEMSTTQHKDISTKDIDTIISDDLSKPLIAPLLLTTSDDTFDFPEPQATVSQQLSDLEKHITTIETVFGTDTAPTTQLYTFKEACFHVVVRSLKRMCDQIETSFDYLEELIKAQLIKAIGHKLTPSDFSEYMDHHCRVKFKEQYRPKLFSYPVQGRMKHDPEGVVEIDGLHTICGSGTVQTSSAFLLDAVTEVQSNPPSDRTSNEVIVHSVSNTTFSDSDLSQVLKLKARSRQFCSFILLIGRLVDEEYVVDQGILVQNKDEIEFILHLEDFKSNSELTGLSGLSPVQREFALAYRKLQLESSLFAFSVIEVKPQLERVLNLPPDILSQEIKLTQQLLELIIKYNIPADLLSYPEEEINPTSEEEIINKIRGYVKTVQEMLQKCKDEAMKNLTETALANEQITNSGGEVNQIVKIQSPPVMVATTSSGDRTASSLPGALQNALEKECQGICVRPTGISVGECHLTSQKGLLGKPVRTVVSASELAKKKFDTLRLLSYLTKHGAIPIQYSKMHILMATTHRFDKTLMNVLVQDNMNPIVLVERSAQLIASAIHNVGPEEVLVDS
eukprot:TRINITY_DN2471_c0_g1_i1.p1 TRINITY_DN2471_c0_g1~~TRINITY_DN2471_c0_g1_i1.p1  ORF type:complete len:805 (+),score=175.58 TRINITY_DN2471_c0_g1_i1:89-2503(+)